MVAVILNFLFFSCLGDEIEDRTSISHLRGIRDIVKI